MERFHFTMSLDMETSSTGVEIWTERVKMLHLEEWKIPDFSGKVRNISHIFRSICKYRMDITCQTVMALGGP